MTINDIMIREMADAEKEAKVEWRRELATRRDCRRWNAIEWSALALAAATIAFLAWCIVSDTPHRFPRHQNAEAAAEAK